MFPYGVGPSMMDWQNLMAAGNMEEGEIQDEEPYDFYGSNDHDPHQDTKPGASAVAASSVRPPITDHEGFSDFHEHFQDLSSSAAPAVINNKPNVTDEQKKAENQRKAELLRAKLLQKRQQTPVKAASAQTQATASKAAPAPQQIAAPFAKPETNGTKQQKPDTLGLDALIAEVQAQSEAKQQEQPQPTEKAAMPVNGATQVPAEPAQEAQADNPPTQLTDPYYADLAAWLDFTGYHNLSYRTSRLRTYKERRALEEEAKRIQERLESLKREEELEMGIMRAKTTHPSTGADVNGAPPALPAELPSRDAELVAETTSKVTNGVKRPHSPPRNDRVTRQRNDTGFRIRGANDSPTDARPPSTRRDERRVSYPDARRRSLDTPRKFDRDAPSRDPSLERRQTYYKRDGERGGPPAASHGGRDRYETYTPGRRGGHNGGGGGRGGHQQYRGSASLELSKGGVRYFMIKSWNHENVIAAQREGLWATQLKNERLLIDAFHESRHIILLFSVNKSTAFQGYALMTSPPSPSLRKPSFCKSLKWDTSPAFEVKWLATTPVHFRMVGHLKNTLNVDEETGLPRAVLVGKDGQEISTEAGKGLVWILDDAEAVAREG